MVGGRPGPVEAGKGQQEGAVAAAARELAGEGVEVGVVVQLWQQQLSASPTVKSIHLYDPEKTTIAPASPGPLLQSSLPL